MQIIGGLCLVTSLGLSYLSTQFWHGFVLFSIFAGQLFKNILNLL